MWIPTGLPAENLLSFFFFFSLSLISLGLYAFLTCKNPVKKFLNSSRISDKFMLPLIMGEEEVFGLKNASHL